MPDKKRVYVKTFGCQMNVYDSERMAAQLSPHGFTETDSPEDADLVILNTCHIREKAAEKVYSELGRVRRIKEARRAIGKDTKVAVAGCVAQAEGAEIARRAPVVDIVVGPQSYHRLPQMLAAAGRGTAVIDTEFPDEDKFAHLVERAAPTQPFGRLVSAPDVAGLATYLLSDASGIVTGSLIDFDQNVMGAYT